MNMGKLICSIVTSALGIWLGWIIYSIVVYHTISSSYIVSICLALGGIFAIHLIVERYYRRRSPALVKVFIPMVLLFVIWVFATTSFSYVAPSPGSSREFPLPSTTPKSESVDKSIPQGTYAAGTGKEIITFKEDKLVWISAAGKSIYKFEIVGAIITLTDIATGKIERRTFEYDKQDNFVVINDRLFCEEIPIETVYPEVPVRELIVASQIHQLVNEERQKRRILPVKWSEQLARQAQSQVEYCAEVGDLVHSSRYAFQGGENLFWVPGVPYARAIVDTWLGSTQGHREYLLSPRVKYAGVGVVYKNGETFAAWAFADMALFTEFSD